MDSALKISGNTKLLSVTDLHFINADILKLNLLLWIQDNFLARKAKKYKYHKGCNP
jgi:hypothetical protein